MIKASCSNCGKTFKAPDEYAGKTAKCPSCKNTIDIPTNEILSDNSKTVELHWNDDVGSAFKRLQNRPGIWSSIMSVIALVIAIFVVIGGFMHAENVMQEAAIAGLGCFFGIISRVFQADAHHAAVLKSLKDIGQDKTRK